MSKYCKYSTFFKQNLFSYSSLMDFHIQSTCSITFSNVVTSLSVFQHQQISDYRSSISLCTTSVQLSSLLEVCSILISCILMRSHMTSNFLQVMQNVPVVKWLFLMETTCKGSWIVKDKGYTDILTIHQIKQRLTMFKYYNVINRHRQSTSASYFCNYGKQEVAGCVCRFYYVLLSIVLFYYGLVILLQSTLHKQRKACAWVENYQLVDFQNTVSIMVEWRQLMYLPICCKAAAHMSVWLQSSTA